MAPSDDGRALHLCTIAESLRDLLVRLLNADTVAVELRDRITGATHFARTPVPPKAASIDARFCCVTIGLTGDMGRVTVGSSEPAFPSDADMVLLRAAVNHVGNALQHASLLDRHETAE